MSDKRPDFSGVLTQAVEAVERGEDPLAGMRRVLGANTGHGHVRPRPDGAKARCGGPALCAECKAEQDAVVSAFAPLVDRDVINVGEKPALAAFDGRDPPHNAEEAKADDRQLLASLRKIDDVDAKLWRLQQRIAAGESERQALSSEISGLRADLARNTKGDHMVRNMLILLGVVAVLALVGITVWAALTAP